VQGPVHVIVDRVAVPPYVPAGGGTINPEPQTRRQHFRTNRRGRASPRTIRQGNTGQCRCATQNTPPTRQHRRTRKGSDAATPTIGSGFAWWSRPCRNSQPGTGPCTWPQSGPSLRRSNWETRRNQKGPQTVAKTATHPAWHWPEQAALDRPVTEPYVPAGHTVEVAAATGQYEP
jgi:hypothetical protein